MESAYNFVKITLLGLIAGILIILLMRIDYWVANIEGMLRKPAVYQENKSRNDLLEKNRQKQPDNKTPHGLKFKI